MSDGDPIDQTVAAVEAGVRDEVRRFVDSETHGLMRKVGATRGNGGAAVFRTGLFEILDRLPACEEQLIAVQLDLGVRDPAAIAERIAAEFRTNVATMGFGMATAAVRGYGGLAAQREADRFKASVEAHASGVASRALVAVEKQRRKDGAMVMKPIQNGPLPPPRVMTLAELLAHNEDTWLDWKAGLLPGLTRDPSRRDQHRGKLLKSLVSLANSIVDQCGYLVYGVDNENGPRQVVGVTEHFDDAEFQDWNRRTFSPPVQFHYREEPYDGKTVAIFEIKPASEFPHVCKASLGGELYDGQVWIRQGSMNTVANHDDLERLFAPAEPVRTTQNNGPVVQAVRAIWEPLGWEPFWPGVHDRDDYLAKGCRVAYAPGTRREIRFVHSNTDVHLLMLRRKS